MAHYMVQASYTSDALAALVRIRKTARQGSAPWSSALAARSWRSSGAQGEFDLVVIVDVPDAEVAPDGIAAPRPGRTASWVAG